MPADRSRLHLTKIDEFAGWAVDNGFNREDTKGTYEVLRLRGPKGGPPLIWYRRDSGQHATTQFGQKGQHNPSQLVGKWLRWKRTQAEG